MNGFISYASVDRDACRAFRIDLSTTERKFGIAIWHDEHIRAGDHWHKEIGDAIARADLFLFLVSPQFLASNYIHMHEIPAIKRRLRVSKSKAISVLLRPCDPEFALGRTQLVPSDAETLKPVEKWRPHSDGFNAARDQIDTAITHYFGLTPRRSRWTRP